MLCYPVITVFIKKVYKPIPISISILVHFSTVIQDVKKSHVIELPPLADLMPLT
jgi:hypothetical protein